MVVEVTGNTSVAKPPKGTRLSGIDQTLSENSRNLLLGDASRGDTRVNPGAFDRFDHHSSSADQNIGCDRHAIDHHSARPEKHAVSQSAVARHTRANGNVTPSADAAIVFHNCARIQDAPLAERSLGSEMTVMADKTAWSDDGTSCNRRQWGENCRYWKAGVLDLDKLGETEAVIARAWHIQPLA